jgi:hypothetical protein
MDLLMYDYNIAHSPKPSKTYHKPECKPNSNTKSFNTPVSVEDLELSTAGLMQI